MAAHPPTSPRAAGTRTVPHNHQLLEESGCAVRSHSPPPMVESEARGKGAAISGLNRRRRADGEPPRSAGVRVFEDEFDSATATTSPRASRSRGRTWALRASTSAAHRSRIYSFIREGGLRAALVRALGRPPLSRA